jgi:hypothetical protein
MAGAGGRIGGELQYAIAAEVIASENWHTHGGVQFHKERNLQNDLN